MNKQIYWTLLWMVVIVSIPSCTVLIGIKKLKPLSENTIIKQADKFHIPRANSYVLDTSYLAFIYNATTDNKLRNDHLQPLQAVYYTKENGFIAPVSWQINCYAGGFPNLKWNRNGIMESFPPKEQAPLDSLVSLKKQFEFLRSMTGVVPFNSIEYDYIIVVYWSRFMNRQSKKLIQTVQKNAALAVGKKVRIVYVNNDQFFTKME
jgi:hypothetical protein